MVEIRDYNGMDRWAAAAIQARYSANVQRFGVASPRDLSPRVDESHGVRWVYPVMDQVIQGIEAGDVACAQIGVEFIEEDQGFAFGAILKSNTARALRRFPELTDEQIGRIRRRVASLYSSGVVPREFAQYLKLFKRVGPGAYWQTIQDAEPKNHHARQAQRYFATRFDRDGRPAPKSMQAPALRAAADRLDRPNRRPPEQ